MGEDCIAMKKNSNEEDGGKKMKRRNVLATMGSIAGVGLVGSEFASARSQRVRKYRGISYETVSERQQGSVSARIKNKGGGAISGVLKVGGYTLSLGNGGSLEPYFDQDNIRKYKLTASGPNKTENGLPLLVRFEIQNDELMAGVATRPRSDYENLGFSLAATDRPRDVPLQAESLEAEIASGLNPNPTTNVTVPKTGIPKDANAPSKITIESSDSSQDMRSTDVSTQSSQDSGIVGEDYRNGSKTWSPPSRCSDQRSMTSNWRYDAAFFGGDTYDHNYNQIEQDASAIWWFQSHFKDKPESLLCSYDHDGTMDEPAPIKAEYEVGLGTNESQQHIDFFSPSPDNDTNDSGGQDDGIIGLTLNIVAGVGGKYTSIATSVFDFIMNGGGSGSDYIHNKESWTNSDGVPKVKMSWNIGLSGSDLSYFPDAPDKAAGVQFSVDNGHEPSYQGTITGKSRFTFTHLRYPDNSCRCTSKYRYTVTTPYTSVNAVYDSIQS